MSLIKMENSFFMCSHQVSKSKKEQYYITNHGSISRFTYGLSSCFSV